MAGEVDPSVGDWAVLAGIDGVVDEEVVTPRTGSSCRLELET